MRFQNSERNFDVNVPAKKKRRKSLGLHWRSVYRVGYSLHKVWVRLRNAVDRFLLFEFRAEIFCAGNSVAGQLRPKDSVK